MALKSETTVLLVTLAAASILGICVWQWTKRKKVFVKVGTVKALYHFPIKSLAANEVSELDCTSYGALSDSLLDRTFMLATNEGMLITQREEPSMVLLKAKICGDYVLVSGGDKDPLKVCINDKISQDEKIVVATIHGGKISLVDCGDEAAGWFQDYFKRQDVRLLRYALGLSKRKINTNDPYLAKLKKNLPFYLQDEGPFHVITQSSLDELNTISESKVSVLNFRPNILIEGSEPFDEDNWKYISFSSGAELSTLMPCGRCVLTTNDPETAVKTNKEPLVALRKFRMSKDKKLAQSQKYAPFFGLVCTLVKPGLVRVGDDVYAVCFKNLYQFGSPQSM